MNLTRSPRKSRAGWRSIFLKDEDGRRPVNGGAQKFQEDPHWRDCIQFYEYFHGDNGAGLGASHQTGWTGVIARAMHLFATTHAGAGARARQEAAFARGESLSRVNARRRSA